MVVKSTCQLGEGRNAGDVKKQAEKIKARRSPFKGPLPPPPPPRRVLALIRQRSHLFTRKSGTVNTADIGQIEQNDLI